MHFRRYPERSSQGGKMSDEQGEHDDRTIPDGEETPKPLSRSAQFRQFYAKQEAEGRSNVGRKSEPEQPLSRSAQFRQFYANQEAEGRVVGKTDTSGRILLKAGSKSEVSEEERSRRLEEELQKYAREGFFVQNRTATTAQLVRPKKFSFIWALLWFLVFGLGVLVYLIYYASKKDEGRFVEVDEYGAVRATRQG
jgi:hypothetical protein